jgi:hypothetical protein
MFYNETFFIESPRAMSYKGFEEEDDFSRIFPIGQTENEDNINLDNLYFLRRLNSNDSSNKEISIENKLEMKKKDDNSILDDYELYYNKFKNNEIKPEKEDNSFPFENNLTNEEKLVYSYIEDEIMIIIENQESNQKLKKEKIIEVVKDLKKKKYLEEKKKMLFKQNQSEIQADINNNKFFPFTPGNGLILNLNRNNESEIDKHNIFDDSKDYNEEKTSEETNRYIETINNGNDNCIFKFMTKKYYVGPDGKKKKVKKSRKFKSDDIRKKIKSRFHKALKNIINENLKKAGSKELFDFFPQCFLGNVTRKANSKYFNLTYKELLSTNFEIELKKEVNSNNEDPKSKYNKNIKIIDYLEKNPYISQISGFDLIKDMKYKDILNNYFNSKQFEDSINQLKDEKESPEYILNYINKAKNYVNFYTSDKNNTDDKEKENIEEEDIEEDEKEL